MIEKTGIIGGLELPEKAEHTRESKGLPIHLMTGIIHNKQYDNKYSMQEHK